MPRAKDSLKVEVSEQTADETRTIVITITAPAQDFLLTDLLHQRGAVSALEVPLRQAVRDTLQAHLDGAEALIAGVVAGQKKGTAAQKTKGKQAPVGITTSHANGTGNGAHENLA